MISLDSSKHLIMKLPLFISALLLTVIFADAQITETTQGSEFCAHGKLMRPRQENSGQRSPNSPRHTFDVLNYELDLDIYHCYASPYPRTFTASNIITFLTDTLLSSIKLNADQTSLQINAMGLAADSFIHDQDTLTIILNRVYQPGEIATVSIEYEHLDVPDLAFYVGNGFVFTDCEPQGARKWFPCYDQPYDKATLTLRAKVPANVKLGSNGSLADSVTVNDTTWYTWVSRDPVATYLMVISSRVDYNLDIVYWTKPGPPHDTLPIRFYYNPGENPTQIKNMIIPLADFFYSMFGDHPFEKDGFATLNPQFMWGGMENQTLTSLCQGCWYSSLIAHEFAHQWFGDMITCATWADLWLNEGFATYFEATWTGQVNGQQAYKNQMIGNASYYLAQNPGWAISNPAWATNPPANSTLFNYAITYMKASCVLYMYRYVVGDSLFFHSIYEYANDTVDFRYKSATIPDFIEKMNETTGQELNWFFEQWLFQPNHPVYNNSYSFLELEDDKWNVYFKASQVQTNAPFFKMPLEILINFKNGGDTLIRVTNDENDQVFVFQFDQEPVALTFDPGNNILLKQGTTVAGSDPVVIPNTREIQITPNPASTRAIVSFSIETKMPVRVLLTDISGKKLIDTGIRNYMPGFHSLPIDIRNYPSGAYLLTLQSENQLFTKKLIVSGN